MECGICFEKYNSNTQKPYSIYPCGHNYCKNCLDALEKRECPSCKTSIKDIHVNYGLIHLLNELPVDNKILKEQIQNKISKTEDENNKLIKLLNESKMKNFKSNKLRQEIESKRDELSKILNELSNVSSSYNSKINECNNVEKLISSKLNSIKNSFKDSKDLDNLNKEVSSLNINSEIKKISIANKEFEDNLTNIKNKILDKEANKDDINNLAKKYLEQSNKLFFESKFEQAIELINKSIALKDDNVEAYFLKGRSLGRLERYEEAKMCYEKSLELDPNHYPSYNRKAYVLESFLSQKNEAQTLYQLALELNSNPNNANGYFNKALTLDCLNENEKALEFYDKAIQLDPTDPIIYFNKSFCLSLLERYQESILNLDKAIELKPNYDLFHSNKASDLENLGQYMQAINCCNKALELNSKNCYAYTIKLRIIYDNFKNYHECIETANKALKENTKYFKAYEFKLDSLEKLNLNEEALKLNEFLLKNYSYLSNNYRYKLAVLTETKNCKEALKLVNNVLYYGIKSLFLYQIKINNLISLKRYEEALELLEYAFDLPEDDICSHSETFNYKGDVLCGLKRKKEAIESYKKSLELNPNNSLIEKKIKDLKSIFS